jgi:hypothetical protein
LWVRFDEIKSCNSASSDPSGCFLSTQKVESTNDRLWWVDWCRNDPSSAVVPDVSVEIADNAKGTAQSTKTDREGVYQFFFLAPARYTLTVTRDGCRKEKRAVTVLVRPTVTVNFALELAKESTPFVCVFSCCYGTMLLDRLRASASMYLIVVCFNCESASSATVITSLSSSPESRESTFFFRVPKMLTCKIRDSSTSIGTV